MRNIIKILTIAIAVTLNFCTAAPLESSDASNGENQNSMEKNPSQAKGRNVPVYENNFNDDMLDPHNAMPGYDLSPYPSDAYPLGFDDSVDVGPTQFAPNLGDPEMDLNGAEERDMAGAESNIVFRPLFSYRQQVAQRRKIYSRSTTSAPVVNNQRRQQGYPYRYPSYGYTNYYPSYYYNAQYDYVP